MPKYICEKCGEECHGRILHTLKACHFCGEPIRKERVEDDDAQPLRASASQNRAV